MATTTVNALTAKTTPIGADLLLIEDSAASNASKKSTIANLAKGMQAAAVADANQTIAGPSIAEVQALSDKVDELLGALRTANLLAT